MIRSLISKKKTNFKPSSSLSLHKCLSTAAVEDHDDSSHSNVTAANKHFPKLFSPLDLGPDIGKIPNRVIMGSMHTGLEGHSIPSFLMPLLKPDFNHRDLSQMATYFQKRAEGGCGLMVTGGKKMHRIKSLYFDLYKSNILIFINIRHCTQ